MSDRATPVATESTLLIRPFRPDDYAAVYALWEVAEGVEISTGDTKAEIEAYLRRNPDCSRVAECAGRVVGAVLAGYDGRRGYLYHLAVNAAFRRQKLGERLVTEALAALKAAGVLRVIILVKRTNAAGLDFWTRRGFEPIDEARPMGLDL